MMIFRKAALCGKFFPKKARENGPETTHFRNKTGMLGTRPPGARDRPFQFFLDHFFSITLYRSSCFVKLKRLVLSFKRAPVLHGDFIPLSLKYLIGVAFFCSCPLRTKRSLVPYILFFGHYHERVIPNR